MKRSTERLTLLLTIAAWLGGVAARADWPLVRGDAAASGVAPTPLIAPLEELWTYRAADSGFAATASIVDGVVYVGDVDGTFHAVGLADGQSRWTRKFTGETRLSGNKPLWVPRSASTAGFIAGTAVVEGRVYCVDFNGAVRCLDAADGRLLWQLGTESQIYAAPNLHEGRLLIVTEAGELLAVDAENGEVRWTFAIDQPLRCWPTVIDQRALVAGCDAKMHAIDVKTGKPVASLEIGGPADAIPAARDGRVFFCTAGGVFHALQADPLKTLWEFRHAGQGEQIHAAAVNDAVVVFGTHRKEVVALDPATGEQLWTFSVRSRVESSPVLAGSLAVFATLRGRLYAVDATQGDEKWQQNVGGRFTSSPAVSDGKLVIGNEDGTLYCFGNP